MVGEHRFDEADVALLDALHVHPRATFELLAATLEVSPMTAARRWHRLAGEGRAWVASVPGPSVALAAAVYDVAASPGCAERVARALAELPRVVSVYRTSGDFDIQTLVIAAEPEQLAELALHRLSGVEGVARTRVRVGVELFSGARWRLGAISGSQAREVHRADQTQDPTPARGQPEARGSTPTREERALYLALQQDGRAPYRGLARELGVSEQQVRRRMASMARRGLLTFRTDFVRAEGGWPVQVVLGLAVPFDRLREAGAEVAAWPETRICLATVDAANLFVMAQLHQLAELGGLFERIRATLPGADVVEQRVVLRPVKSWGRLLGSDGRSAGLVPVDPWAAG